MHVLPSSRVPDHCRAFALSYQGDTDYVSACSHDHDPTCVRCDLLIYIVCEIESALENVEISNEEKGEMKYVVSLAKKRIEAWKAHLLRRSIKMKRDWMPSTLWTLILYFYS